jgi:tetratricopeptide (TPR) repeat protein
MMPPMSLARAFYLLIPLALASLARGQSIAELLPPSMKLDDKGLLQWTEFRATPCTHCKATGQTPCTFCADARDTKCSVCADTRTAVCVACRGTRKSLDPFLSRRCSFCGGHGRRGSQKSTVECELCAGKGHLPAIRIEGEDPRSLDEKPLARAMRVLRKRRSQIDDETVPRDEDLATTSQAVTLAMRKILELAQIPADRAAGIVTQMMAGPDAKDPEHVVMTMLWTRRDLLRMVDANTQLLATCRWRHRYNARVLSGEKPTYGHASALQWTGWFGADPKAPADTYTLLGRGFFRAETAPNTDDVIRKWLKAHPKAVVVPVSIMSGIRRGQAESRLVFCWIRDGDAWLNLHLVERGCIRFECVQAPIMRLEVTLAEYTKSLDTLKTGGGVAKKGKRGIWGSSDLLKEQEKRAARELMKDNEYAKALVHLLKIVEMGRAGRYEWLDIAECHDELDHYEKASDAYDKAIGDGGWWQPYTDKAEFIERNKGLAKAVAWLENLRTTTKDDRKFSYLLGSFHKSGDRDADAIPYFKHVVELVCKTQGFKFGKDFMLILDAETLAKGNNEYAELWPTLEYLAESCYEMEDRDGAFRYATMGVAIGQQLNRCKGYYEQDEIDAGDCDCRLLRAAVFMDRDDLDAAQTEIDKANVLAERGSYSGHKRGVRHARERLQDLRDKRCASG